MPFSGLAFRPLRGARLRVVPWPRLSSSFRFGYITRSLHDGRHENYGDDNDGDDDDDDDGGAMQEDYLPGFRKNFFHVRLGQVFQGRYRTVRKMQWDRCWTLWFCLDQKCVVAFALSTRG